MQKEIFDAPILELFFGSFMGEFQSFQTVQYIFLKEKACARPAKELFPLH